MTDWRHHRTERLWLDAATDADADVPASAFA